MSRLSRPQKNSKRCHSERSEESLLVRWFSYTEIEERFFASLRMTEVIFFASCESLTSKTVCEAGSDYLADFSCAAASSVEGRAGVSGGAARKYCAGQLIDCFSSRAVRKGQYGSRRNSRAIRTKSA
jgi:hypothetical protein